MRGRCRLQAERRELALRRATSALVAADDRHAVEAAAADAVALLVDVPVRVRLTAAPEPGTLVVPLAAGGRALGALVVDGPEVVLDGLRDTLEALGDVIALALLSQDRQEARFRSLVEHSPDVLTVLGRDRRVHYQSPAVARYFGFPPGSFDGADLLDWVHPDDRDCVSSALGVAGEDPARCTARLRHADGGWRSCEISASDLRGGPNGSALVLNIHDVSERVALEGQLVEQAFTDTLTGLANRRLFITRVEQAAALGTPLAVLFCDLDDFKTVNDSLGHAAGDELLVGVAARLRHCLRPEDVAARLGGDEFAVLLEGRGSSAAREVAERVVEALRTPFTLAGKSVIVQVSVGIATDADGRTVEELLRNADAAMYVAKGEGKDQAAEYASDMHAAALARLELRADLQRAVERAELVIHYQPVVELAAGHIAWVEALVRWQHPEHGLVAPSAFIPAAEEAGLVAAIGRIVLNSACRQVRAWQAIEGYDRLKLSVNLSAAQLRTMRVVDDVAAALDASGLDAGDLVLELTESVFMHTHEATGVLCALKELGVLLAIDDFGTGYSSLSYLREFPFDILKVDRSFVTGVAASRPDDRALVQAIIRLGHSLRLVTVAEGIESEVELAELRRLGCHLGQGFLFAEPRDAATVGANLAGSSVVDLRVAAAIA